jgi:hypothetical protein
MKARREFRGEDCGNPLHASGDNDAFGFAC